MKQKFPHVLSVFIAIIGLFLISGSTAFADNGGIDVNVKDELGNNLVSTNVQVQCTGGAMTTIGSTDGSGNLSRTLAQLPVPAGCNADNEAITVQVNKDGYVTRSDIQGANYQTDAQNSYNITGVQFGHKVVVVDELNSSLAPEAVTAGLNDVACTVSSNSAYCPVLLAEDNALDATTAYSIERNGYVTAVPNLAGSRAAGTTAQQVVTLDASTGLDFSHKIVVKDELNNNLTPSSATAGLTSVPCTVSTNNVYCPIFIAEDNTLTNGFSVVKDGYVTAAVDLASNRTLNTDAQALVTMDATNGLDFSHKVIVVDELGNNLTPDSVTAGLNDTACTISTNNVYCAVPLADDNALDGTTAYAITEDGYVTATPNLAGSRGAGATAQQVVTLDAATGLDFGFKVTGVADELGNALSSVTVDAGNSFGTSCTELSGAWYCAVPLAHAELSIRVVKSGYITNAVASFDADRTVATNAQQAKSVSNVQFRLKIVVLSSTGSALSDATVTHGGTSFAQASTNSYYFTTTGAGAIAVSKSGYDSFSVAVDTGLSSVSTNSSAQTVVTLNGTTPYTGADPVGTSVTGSGLVVSATASGSDDDEGNSSGSVATPDAVTVVLSPENSVRDQLIQSILIRLRDLLIELLGLYGVSAL